MPAHHTSEATPTGSLPDRFAGCKRSFLFQSFGQSWFQRVWKSAQRVVAQNIFFLYVCIAYCCVVFFISRLYRFGFILSLYNLSLLITGLAMIVLFIAVISVTGLLCSKPDHPFSFVRKHVMDDWALIERLSLALPIVLVFPLFSSSFTSLKSALGALNGYDLDPLLASIDESIHGGRAAWQVLHPLIGRPLITFVLNFAYGLWFLAMLSVLTLVSGWIERPLIRMQYLVAFISCWILLGSISAVTFASVGPCYFGLFYPDRSNPFAALMAYLHSANEIYPVKALDAQQYLWSLYTTHAPGLGKGISAMPSLHVAIAMLNAIIGWKVSRVTGLAATAFLILILLGSIHLGWHYGIDGYFSLIAVPIIWLVSGRIVRSGQGSSTAEPRLAKR